MQQVQVIGTPLSVFRSLADHLNRLYQIPSEWSISVNPIARTEEFWAAAARYRNRIGELDLRYVVPNIWDGQTETERALKKLHNETNAQEVEVRLINRDRQIQPDTSNIRDSVDYISRGGGSITIKEGNKKLYSSEDNVVTETPEEDLKIQESDARLLIELIRRLFRL
jgi:hypothetical protein